MAEIARRMDELQAEWTDLNTQKSAWLVILGDESGEPVAVATEENPAPPPSHADITDVARWAISQTGEDGFRPKDITTKVEALRGSLASGFVSNLLFRLKKKGEVVEYAGKYYLPRFDPQPRLNMNAGKDQQQTPP